MLRACYHHAVGNLQIKNVPDDLHGELRRRAGRAGLTVRDYLLRLIAADQRLPSADEWLDELRTHPPVALAAGDAVRAVADSRREREDGLLGGVSAAGHK